MTAEQKGLSQQPSTKNSGEDEEIRRSQVYHVRIEVLDCLVRIERVVRYSDKHLIDSV